jgi:hypothetical protein
MGITGWFNPSFVLKVFQNKIKIIHYEALIPMTLGITAG